MHLVLYSRYTNSVPKSCDVLKEVKGGSILVLIQILLPVMATYLILVTVMRYGFHNFANDKYVNGIESSIQEQLELSDSVFFF